MDIRTKQKENCPLCETEGDYLHRDLKERLFFNCHGYSWNIRVCKNMTCRHMWIDPSPIKEDLHKLYTEYYTHDLKISIGPLKKFYQEIIEQYFCVMFNYPSRKRGTTKWIWPLLYFFPWRLPLLNRKIMYLPYVKDGRLLEIGFGNGERLGLLSSLGWQAIGVDFDQTSVNNGLREGLRVSLGDVTEQKYPDDYFDAIISSHVIEHIPDPKAWLDECMRILKPGGRLICTTPNNRSLGHSLFERNWRDLDPPRHLHIFSPASLCSLITSEKTRCTTSKVGASTLFDSYWLYKGYDPIVKKNQLNKFAYLLIFEALHIFEWISSAVFRVTGEELVFLVVKQR
uniref:Methyltransferase domain-containing protein n=1 Tax=Candidatus Kentrum sp. UNK TaxID=2126344 RepID=A0A451A8G1_9GAMM|nr:MAG: Methyltransferase domain-containing protein [Candidatus Kentron sp. UNK]VFK70419.1 MAG: Methyltransferase domain-containing protein [Candidatus Kentron sp. UNK]